MILTREQLRGMSRERAELYGKPHIGCRYLGSRYELTRPRCIVCGRPASNCHHVAHRSWGRTFRLETPNGSWELLSPLFALCGSGTTGCHGGFHGGARLTAEWRWRSEESERMWWSGELLQGYRPHDPGLFRHGYWAIKSNDGTEIIRER